MKQFYLKRIYILLFAAGLLCAGVGCSEEPATDPSSGIVLSGVILPSEYTLPEGGTLLFWGNGFQDGDKVQLTSSDGTKTLDISIENGKVSFVLPDDFKEGYYKFTLVRGNATKTIGYALVEFGSSIEIPDKEGMNIKGMVVAEDETGIPGVCVSDGIEVVKTDENGFYYIESKKKTGFVFVVVPGGYEVETDMCLPQFYKRLSSKNTGIIERADFTLKPVDNTNYTLIAATDLHLANRTSNNEKGQFEGGFMADVKQIIQDRKGNSKNTYCVTMGDLTWDIYWYDNKYALPEYQQQLGNLGCPIFNVMGNHDYDMLGKTLVPGNNGYSETDPYMNESDWVSATSWRNNMGPTYYSFNIGGVHFLSLDDMICKNQGTSGSRSTATTVDADQMAWIAKDLSFVDKSTPVFVMMHIPHKSEPSILNVAANRMTNANEFKALFSGYKEVHILDGHTHYGFNVVDNSGGNLWYEHTTPAVCGTWWWTGRPGYSTNNIAPDGAPGGFGVYEIEGKNVTWKYKGAGKDIDYQFRTYDLNTTVLSTETYLSKASTSLKNTWKNSTTYAYHYQSAKENKILINIWNWDPDWSISVKEGTGGSATDLSPTRVQRTDPLQLISYPALRMNEGTTPTFDSRNSTHFFEVQANTAQDPITITVTDRFGNVYTETMTRPKYMSLTME